MKKYEVDADIRKARTISKEFYLSMEAWERAKKNIFSNSWQYLGDKNILFRGGIKTYPKVYMENYLEEPLLLTKANETIQCMSNVCTHRGFILSHHPSESQNLVCKYHGRRFSLEGKCLSMPEFKEVEGFPSSCDHLKKLKLENWKQFLFTSLNPTIDFNQIFSKLDERIGFFGIENFTHCPQYDKVYSVNAHWALYCENFLEGFHIPFVHNDLNALIDYGEYTTQCYDDMVLQIAYASDGTAVFDLPKEHPDFGKNVAAYYYWIFPNMMLNFYSWGMQLNFIMPVTPKLTKVHFIYYLKNQQDLRFKDGDQLGDKTEREDEFVVEGVQQGLESKLYTHGRFSPTREKGVHYFQKRIAHYMNAETEKREF